MNENFDLLLKKYANLIVKKGLNIQKDGLLIINSPIKCDYFARKVAEAAFKIGAKDVFINYSDEDFTKIRLQNASIETVSEIPDFEVEKYNYYISRGASVFAISASNPELLKDVDPKKISSSVQARSKALKEVYSDKLMSNENAWCIVSIPTKEWAMKVFNDVSSKEAIELLWNSIFDIMRLNSEDPIKSWDIHLNNIKKHLDFFNKNNFKYLKMKNSLGTDLKVELPLNHIWCGGSELTKGGVEFIANMPTEEIFTTPKRDGVNGVVYASKPLNYNGTLINDFNITFKKGEIVNFDAKEGLEALRELINTDEGSRYLGEVALVPYNSPISNSNILFYNTLYDENASCHLAIGEAYPSCIKDGENLSKEELLKAGSNVSLTHVDFMFGTSDLEIIGVTYDDKTIEIFKDGNYAF
ncbi:aminopeptidase [Clostridium chrysemydis]|uniref:aminopeptidase n=1 Tax=Clostridium chrysemydis TaxID=2665504 RepID=UPI0018845D6C|nr:aminopeptidase [Clostridium chrysemydis]